MVFNFNSSYNFVQDRIYPWDRKFGKFFYLNARGEKANALLDQLVKE